MASEKVSAEALEAVTRLMAAAPDLLEALRGTLALVTLRYGNTDECANQVQLLAFAALHKATGERHSIFPFLQKGAA